MFPFKTHLSSQSVCFVPGLSKSRTSSISSLAEIDIGDKVIVAGQRKGTIKFVGDTKFAPGMFVILSYKSNRRRGASCSKLR